MGSWKNKIRRIHEEVKIEDYKIEKTVKGSEFEGKKYIHPLLGFNSRIK